MFCFFFVFFKLAGRFGEIFVAFLENSNSHLISEYELARFSSTIMKLLDSKVLKIKVDND